MGRRRQVLEIPRTRTISQKRLRRFLGLSDVIEQLLQMYAGFRDDLVEDIKKGVEIEPGPLQAELYRKKKLRIRSGGE